LYLPISAFFGTAEAVAVLIGVIPEQPEAAVAPHVTVWGEFVGMPGARLLERREAAEERGLSLGDLLAPRFRAELQKRRQRRQHIGYAGTALRPQIMDYETLSDL
jgi:hypothetical protein